MAEHYLHRGGLCRDNKTLREWLAGETPDQVLEPDLAIIDPHHHFWETPKRRWRFTGCDRSSPIGTN